MFNKTQLAIIILPPYPANIFFLLSELFAYLVCCIYSIAQLNTFNMKANTMNSDQTAPKGAV